MAAACLWCGGLPAGVAGLPVVRWPACGALACLRVWRSACGALACLRCGGLPAVRWLACGYGGLPVVRWPACGRGGLPAVRWLACGCGGLPAVCWPVSPVFAGLFGASGILHNLWHVFLCKSFSQVPPKGGLCERFWGD